MKIATIALILVLPCLASCGFTANSNEGRALTAPDLKKYSVETEQAADKEQLSGACPVLGDVMLRDYHVMRNQSRRLLKK